MNNHFKLQPNHPAALHLNGKVERAQKTDLEEFYAIMGLKDPGFRERLSEWQHYYNWFSGHVSIGKPPMDRYFELSDQTPM